MTDLLTKPKLQEKSMTLREKEIKEFLSKHCDIPNAERRPIAGDASFRHYERIYDTSGKSYILMDAPPNKEDVWPFIDVDKYLISQGFSAPKILQMNPDKGFLLLEDFGNDRFTRILETTTNPEREVFLYEHAIDVLVRLQKCPPLSTLEEYNKEKLTIETNLLIEWYVPHLTGRNTEKHIAESYRNLWQDLLNHPSITNTTTTLRDYHADNLMWLDNRYNHENVGLLDFQDAVVGSPAYDLVSLLEDARRDVSPELTEKILRYYFKNSPEIDINSFMQAYTILGAQRNCKILGIFSRLSKRDNKHQYLTYIPRVSGYLENAMQNPILTPLRNWYYDNIKHLLKS